MMAKTTRGGRPDKQQNRKGKTRQTRQWQDNAPLTFVETKTKTNSKIHKDKKDKCEGINIEMNKDEDRGR